MSLSIHIVAVGRVKGSSVYLQDGVDAFTKRLKPYASVAFHEISEETITPTRTDLQIQEAEAQRILSKLDSLEKSHSDTALIALSEGGVLLSSHQLAQVLFPDAFVPGGPAGVSCRGTNPPNRGILPSRLSTMILVIGGPLGLSPVVLQRCHWVLSLSPMTFPHQLVRLLVLEQVYRAFRIARGEPYHK